MKHEYLKQFDKFKTGKTRERLLIANNKDITIKEIYNVYKFPLGELLNDYFSHKNKFWWKKKTREYDYVCKAYEEIFSTINIIV